MAITKKNSDNKPVAKTSAGMQLGTNSGNKALVKVYIPKALYNKIKDNLPKNLPFDTQEILVKRLFNDATVDAALEDIHTMASKLEELLQEFAKEQNIPLLPHK